MTEFEEALVCSARDGDRAAFDELIRRTSRPVYARLYLETGDPHRSEDLLQETLLAALRAIGRLADPRGFRAWLLTIAQNTALDAARRDLRLKRGGIRAAGGNGRKPSDSAADLARLASPESPPDEEAQRDEQRRQVLAALRAMPEEYRLPLTLRYIGGESYESIGTQLGLTDGSLRGRLHRGMALLRAELTRILGNEAAPSGTGG